MTAIIQAVVALLTQLLPLITGGGAAATVIDKIIETLISIIPTAVQLAEDLVPQIQNIITALKSSNSVTPEQFQALEAAEAQIDAAFDAAAKAAGDTGD